MIYYPILSAPDCTGWTTLCNFAPNNWEVARDSDKVISVTWADGDCWRSQRLGALAKGEMRTITTAEVAELVPSTALALLSLSPSGLPERNDSLPDAVMPRTFMPVWRAALGLSSGSASTSYEGEIEPFPPAGSLLTFCPFLQFGTRTQNYLLFINVEKSPRARQGSLQIYDAATRERRGAFEVRNNSITIVGLDSLGFGPNDLPVMIAREMAGIPLYFSRTADGACLSLEHSHPPASYAIHGRRWDVQKILKTSWFARLGA
jgi:hypothetical protein